MEVCPQRRAVFKQILSDLSKEKLVYIDESGIDITDRKQRGWGKKGQILVGKKSGQYYQRTNIIAGYVNRKIIAPLVFNGPCNTELVNKWVKGVLEQGA